MDDENMTPDELPEELSSAENDPAESDTDNEIGEQAETEEAADAEETEKTEEKPSKKKKGGIFSKLKKDKSGRKKGTSAKNKAEESDETSESADGETESEEKKGKKGKKTKGKKPKKKAKKPAKKKAKKKSKKKSDDDGEESGGGKKKIIIIIILVLVILGGSAFLAKSKGLIGGDGDGGSVIGKGGSDTGVISADISEQKEDYVEEDAIFTDGADITDENYDPDWYKVNFSYRYGHEAGKGEFEVLDFTDYLKELEEEQTADAEAENSEEAAEETEAETEEESDSEESEESEEETEPEMSEVEIRYDRIQRAESCVKMWSSATGTLNNYRVIGNEGFKYLVSELSKKYNSDEQAVSFRNAVVCSMLFSNSGDLEITKTLLSEDYSYAYTEFTRTLNVARCLDSSLFDGTVLQGITEGEGNVQRFQIEMTYNEDSNSYLIDHISLLDTKQVSEAQTTEESAEDNDQQV
jgi:hypothetical protein